MNVEGDNIETKMSGGDRKLKWGICYNRGVKLRK
jgi:hypothetical protein